MIIEVNTQEYDALDKTGPLLVEFYSKTCGPCKMLAFVLKDISKNDPNLCICTVDFDANTELKERFKVKGFPTLIFLKDGQEISRLEGLKQKPVIVNAINALQ